MTDDIHLTVSNLRKTFRNGPESVSPIDGLDLQVPRGQVLALIGPSGSGKSTLLHCLAGIEKPDEGSMLVDGDNVAAMSSGERDSWRSRAVGLVFQSFHLIDVLNAEDNVLMGLAGKRPDRATRERARELLSRVGLGDRLKHRPSQLSGGQKQRVAIARALIHRPSLVLADEPTGNLDARGAGDITSLLVEQARAEGATVIIVTHDHRVADAANRCLHLEGGRLHAMQEALH